MKLADQYSANLREPYQNICYLTKKNHDQTKWL